MYDGNAIVDKIYTLVYVANRHESIKTKLDHSATLKLGELYKMRDAELKQRWEQKVLPYLKVKYGMSLFNITLWSKFSHFLSVAHANW